MNISGVTLDGNGVYVEAGLVYRDAGGTLLRSRVTDIVTSESNTADTLAGGYRSNFPGIGVAQVTAGGGTPRRDAPGAEHHPVADRALQPLRRPGRLRDRTTRRR